jgi:uncharacterized protein YlaN (UPF0358 family)
MPKLKRNPANRLDRWEISLIKAMTADGRYADQEIQAYFTRPTRTINHARILEIREGRRHKTLPAATPEELDRFLRDWPQIDWATGAHLLGDELLIKAREAMLHAVQGYNNPRTFFKAEMFIVTAVIAWTYLLHYHYKRIGIDCRYKKDGVVQKTRHGADKHWELEACLDGAKCPLDAPTKANLKFLIAIRHEIEHQMTRQIDQAISAKLQACALNFNSALKTIAGDRFGLEQELSFALQFATIDRGQRNDLLKALDLPAHILAMQNDYESRLAADMMRDPRYAYRVAFIEVAANRKGGADEAVQFVRAGTDESEKVSRILMKEAERPKYKPAQIIDKMRQEGFEWFNTHHHSQLWKRLEARDPKKGYGVFLKDDDWWWYDAWVNRVREHCQERDDEIRRAAA